MNTTTRMAIVAIIAALAFIAAGNFAVIKAFAQLEPPTPSPNTQGYVHACIWPQPNAPNAVFCLPA